MPIQPPGSGSIRHYTGTMPAAGAEASLACPAGARWLILAIRTSLTCSAAVANRTALFMVNHAAAFTALAAPNQLMVALDSFDFWGLRGWNQTALTQLGNQRIFQLPDAWHLEGLDQIETFTTNIQAADQWQAITLSVIETLEP